MMRLLVVLLGSRRQLNDCNYLTQRTSADVREPIGFGDQLANTRDVKWLARLVLGLRHLIGCISLWRSRLFPMLTLSSSRFILVGAMCTSEHLGT